MVRVYTSSYWSDCRIGAKLLLVMPDAGALFVPMAVRLISPVVCYFGGHQAAQKTVVIGGKALEKSTGSSILTSWCHIFLVTLRLPLVPSYVSYGAGESMTNPESGRRITTHLAAAGLGFCFVLGFSTVFVLLAASATALGQVLFRYRSELNLVAGTVVILFALFMLKMAWLQRDLCFHVLGEGGQPVAAYVLGLAFRFGWTPCIGPVLGTILTVAAAQASVAEGVTLLAVHSLGLGLPFVLAALFTDGLTARINAIRRVGRPLQLAAGGIMVLMGIAMITGQLSAFSFWLLDTDPALGSKRCRQMHAGEIEAQAVDSEIER
jgi:cytochrome c-type biogenesis protein